MADEADQPSLPAPRPVIPLDPAEARVLDAELVRDDAPPMAIAEPGVVAPPPFAQVYSPPPGRGAGAAPLSMTMTPPPAATGYYPPAFTPPPPPPASWPAAPPAQVGYRTADAGGYRRPGVISSLAVTGIVCAVLGVFASAFAGCTGVIAMGFALEHQRGAAGAVPTPAAAPPATAPALTPWADGLGDADRAAVIEAVRGKAPRRLSEARERQLDAFLAEHGKRVFAPPPGGLTTADVAKHIARSGPMPGGDFIVLADGPLCPMPGTLTLHDQNALFESEDNATDLRSVAKAGGSPAASSSPPAGPSSAPPPSSSPSTPGFLAPLRPVALPAGSYTLAIIAAGLCGLVAVYLLVLSIMALRRSPMGGRRLFLIYVAVKIPCGVTAIAAFGWILDVLPGGHVMTAPVTASMTFAALGLIYPVAGAAMVFLNRTARDYFSSAAG